MMRIFTYIKLYSKATILEKSKRIVQCFYSISLRIRQRRSLSSSRLSTQNVRGNDIRGAVKMYVKCRKTQENCRAAMKEQVFIDRKSKP